MYKIFLNCYKKKYCAFKGRANRKEYFSFILFYGLIKFLLNLMFYFTQIQAFLVASSVIIILSIIPSISLSIRRLHDININGYWNLTVIPIIFLANSDQYKNIGIISLLLFGCIFLFIKGTPGENKYGKEPND